MSSKLVAIVGPECSGKTTLARALAEHLEVPWVEEYARGYLTGRSAYDEADLEAIAKGQIALEADAVAGSARVVVLDTDLLVIWVWWREKYGAVPGWLDDALGSQAPRHYLLTRPDISWEADPLRESPLDRERLFDVYQDALAARGSRFDVIEGLGEARLAAALRALEQAN